MAEEQVLDDFRHLWEGDGLLVHWKDSPIGFRPYCLSKEYYERIGLGLYEKVIQLMVESGVAMVDEPPPLKDPIRLKMLKMLDEGVPADEFNAEVRRMRAEREAK